MAEAVNHPSHYNRENAMECIDEMVLVFGEEAVENFCICNAWKYRYRAADKNGEEDLKKSDWYLNKYKELKEKANAINTITYYKPHTQDAIPLVTNPNPRTFKWDDRDWWNYQPIFTCSSSKSE